MKTSLETGAPDRGIGSRLSNVNLSHQLMNPRRTKEAALFHPTKDLTHHAVRSGAVMVATQLAKFVLQVGSTAVMARILTPTDYGQVAMVVALFGFIMLLKDFGLSAATVQRANITQSEISGLFWINVLTGVLLMMVVAACAPLVGWFYGRPELTWLTLAYAALAPVNGLGAQHQALLQRSMRYKSLAVRDLVAISVGVIAGITAAVAGLRYWSLVIMQAATQLAGVATLWWRSDWRPGPLRWTAELRSMLKFGGTLTVSNLLAYVNSGLRWRGGRLFLRTFRAWRLLSGPRPPHDADAAIPASRD